jgi:hypothetical protein
VSLRIFNPQTTMKRKEYRYISVCFHDEMPDIMFCSYAPHLMIDLPIAHELIENRLNFSGGRSVYTLIDFTNVKGVTKEARDYMNRIDGGLKGILGGAFISNNIMATLLINLLLKISKPSVPAKFFTNQQEALKWLRWIRYTQRHQLKYA